MKLLNLQLLAFGCFTQTRLDFGADGGRLHVIYGPNEAGKSTALRALSGFFFGIPGQSGDNFRHEFKKLRIAAELLRGDGERRGFVRRKGSRDTLLDAEEKAVPESDLTPFLAGIGEEAFAAMHCLDHALLLRGGEDLLAGKGELAESLFQAGTGVVGLRRVLAGLESEAERYFKPRGSTSVVNLALGVFEEARKRGRECSLAPRDWKERTEALAALEGDLKGLVERWRQAGIEKHRLERCQLALPKYRQRARCQEELAALGPVILLPENARVEREKAAQKSAEAEARLAQAGARIFQLKEELAGLRFSPELLAQADTINGVLQRVDSYRNALRDLPQVRAESERFAAEAREWLAELKPGLDLEQAETLRIPNLQRQRMQRLAAEYATLEERRQNAAKHSRQARVELDLARREFEAGAPVPDTAELEAVVERVRKLGDLEGQLARDTQAWREAEQQAQIDLGKLGWWRGSLDELESHPFPRLETVDRFDAEEASLRNDRAHLERARLELERELAGWDRELEALRLTGEVPTEDSLQTARARRETGWRLVRQAWLGPGDDPEADRAFDPSHPLPEAFEQAVAHADSVADRLRREADRCAHLAKLSSDRKDGERRRQLLEGESHAAAVRQDDWRRQWTELWLSSGVTPLSPKEMRLWLGQQTRLAGQAAEIRKGRDRLGQLQDTLVAQTAQLAGALAPFGKPREDLPPETLAALVSRAVSIQRQIEEARRQRNDGEKNLRKLEKNARNLELEFEQVEQSRQAWRRAWHETLAPLGLPETILPEEVRGIMEKLDALFNALKERDNRGTRVREMEAYRVRFEEDARALIRALAPDLIALPAELAIAKLNGQLGQAISHSTKRQAIEKQLAQEKEASDKAQADRQRAETQLHACLERAKCAALDALELAEELSEKARRLTVQLEQANQDLAGFTAGAPLGEFLNELAQLNADELPGRTQQLAQEIAALEARRSELEQQAAIARERLRASDGSAQAATAAEEAQTALAAVRDGAEHYLRLKLAAEVLRRQMERYREQNQDPIIRRAGELFPKLTHGSFARLKTGFDDADKVILLGVRPTGEEVDVAGMSDGTRDQLFLALRLASLEKQNQAAEPLPLFVDDILINFDDQRARATLEVLGELAQRTQVLFFTHHERLVELARGALSERDLTVHRLK